MNFSQRHASLMSQSPTGAVSDLRPRLNPRARHAFTLVEIAICLGIIGIALVAIIGILPIGMHTQRDSREETIVGQDASILFEAIRGGSRGQDDLTNYVYAIVNVGTGPNGPNSGYGYTNALAGQVGFNPAAFSSIPPGNWSLALTNGANIIGLMSTPEFTDLNGFPTNQFNGPPYNSSSNHIIAYVSAMSGVAGDQPPQDNSILRSDAFSYRVYCVNAAVAMDTNAATQLYNRNLSRNLHELRTTFLWPLLPNGSTGKGRQTFRMTIAGQIMMSNTLAPAIYFYQPQAFTNAP